MLLQSVGSIDSSSLPPLQRRDCPPSKQRTIDSTFLAVAGAATTAAEATAAAEAATAVAAREKKERYEETGRRYARDVPAFAWIHKRGMQRMSDAILCSQKTTIIRPFTFSCTQQRAEKRKRQRQRQQAAQKDEIEHVKKKGTQRRRRARLTRLGPPPKVSPK